MDIEFYKIKRGEKRYFCFKTKTVVLQKWKADIFETYYVWEKRRLSKIKF